MTQLAHVNVISEYNDILCGIKKRFSKDATLNENTVKKIGRFVFTYYLDWTPQDIKTRLTPDILEKFKLDKLFKKYADFPHELDAKKDVYYYAHWLYPDIIPYDVRGTVLKVYCAILDGKKSLFTMNFFNDDYAMERAEICLQEALKRNEFKNEYEMYALFASDKAADFLNKFKLAKPCQMYYKSPIHFLYESLPNGYKNDFWFNYFVFLPQYKRRITKIQ